MIQVCTTVGVPRAEEMRAELSTRITILGMDLNTGRMIISSPADKLLACEIPCSNSWATTVHDAGLQP